MNMPPRLVSGLGQMGYPARHASGAGLSRASDADIVKVARRAKEVILTHDLDYSRILALGRSRHPSVIIFRPGDLEPDRLFSLLRENLSRIRRALEKGALVVIEDKSVRVRDLPL